MMRTALDMFGPHDATTLGDIVLNIDEYDDEDYLYVDRDGPFRPDMRAMVVDESSERHWRVVRDLDLVEHGEMHDVKELIRYWRDDNASIESLVRSLETM